MSRTLRAPIQAFQYQAKLFRGFSDRSRLTILETLRADPGVNLIISDYAMPHLSGSEVIRRARKIRPGLSAIIITGYAEDDGLDLSKEDVVTLNKPFSPNQLRAAISEAMAMRVPA